MKPISKLLTLLSYLHTFFIKAKKYCIQVIYRSRWENVGCNVRYNLRNSIFSFKNISIGNNVYIGPGAIFLSTDAKLRIGNNILFGPNVTIITGDHITNIVGKFIKENRNKSNGKYDKDVVISDDVWVGTSAIILKGVNLGRGSIIAAGSLVRKNVLPYTIVGGIPAKQLSYRFSFEDALTHEKALYGNSGLKSKDLMHLKSSAR